MPQSNDEPRWQRELCKPAAAAMKLNTPGLLFVSRVDRLGKVQGNLPFSVGKGNEDVSNGLGECLGTPGLKEVGTAKATKSL